MYSLLRPLLFRLDPEFAHKLVLHSMALMPSLGRLASSSFDASPTLNQTLWNLKFPHPIGLAAGLDKDGIAIDGLLSCGFSFIEVGTVTPKPQPGNATPRLFRLLEDQALINRMGFNNQGAAKLAENVRRRRKRGVVGVNLGKNKTTPNEQAASDYLALLDALYPLPDYVVINVSSPNTPGLRDLQTEESLIPLAKSVLARRDEQYESYRDRVRPHKTPVLVKLAPDLTNEALSAVAQGLLDIGIDGFIATNTTLSREGISSAHSHESGGLSGKPLKKRSTEVIRILYQATRGRVPIVGSGGVFDADDAYEKVCAGANLVQVYTGFIYRGPQIVGSIVTGLEKRLRQDGFSSIQEAVGSSTR
ncbi:quinone-dependent dihydroorotate dehydrogenase [Alicyclobacillus tolerans]|uniref:quinone-dependent dihydroorotate dehydrogenase n=1 Tax=Alicyclobacillus tolerans TaxID=90970 RepID=UPI001F002BA5|nr:quinone-dependent dihydroorotate dehydrogenase [Alicyclobacillus tolerans]MCF8566082.1 quinone-dependent dihydroorotate dehydrogenase [Alicyclobacillus tolerans]